MANTWPMSNISYSHKCLTKKNLAAQKSYKKAYFYKKTFIIYFASSSLSAAAVVSFRIPSLFPCLMTKVMVNRHLHNKFQPLMKI